MAKADILLRGKAYSVACAPGQERRLVALAERLNIRVDTISRAVGDIGEERLLLLASLALLDELDAARRSGPPTPAIEKAATEAISRAAGRIAALAERLETGQ